MILSSPHTPSLADLLRHIHIPLSDPKTGYYLRVYYLEEQPERVTSLVVLEHDRFIGHFVQQHQNLKHWDYRAHDYARALPSEVLRNAGAIANLQILGNDHRVHWIVTPANEFAQANFNPAIASE